jgi:lipopolysaccharide biosynthesis glycosyltransferase
MSLHGNKFMNIFIACDGLYYDQWGVNCLKSIQKHTPWINLTVHIVNPLTKIEIIDVRYFYEDKKFVNEFSKISYYQSVRFLKCPEYFSNNELVMSIDCDSILANSFSKDEFKSVAEKISILHHHKCDRWMAGLVTYGSDNFFRNAYKEFLLSKSIEEWEYGWDQDVLQELSKKFNFNRLDVGDWMSFGKGNGNFLTLKGDQKTTLKYLKNYNKIMETTHVQ